MYQSLQLLIDELCKLQHGINPEFRTPLFLTNKLIMACQGVPVCRIAVSDPGEDLSQLINKLQSSIVAWEKEHTNQGPHSAFFTDRRYYNQDQGRNRNQDRNRYNRNQSYGRSSRPKGHCYICRKDECRSWKHTENEREKAKEEYKTQFSNRFKDRFKDRFKQYIVECEGEEEDPEDFDEIFETLITDINSELNLDKPQPSTIYLTTFGDLISKEATLTCTELANKAFSHSLTTINTTKTTTPNTDPFVYNASTKSYYTSTVFIGIIIDIGASRKSIAGYSQFQAL
jgi:hypothetical protein